MLCVRLEGHRVAWLSAARRRGDGDHRGAASMDGLDDFGVVDALEADGRDPEVPLPELALDDGQRYAFAGHLDRVSVSQLVGAKRRRTAAVAAVRRSSARAPALLQCADLRQAEASNSRTGRAGLVHFRWRACSRTSCGAGPTARVMRCRDSRKVGAPAECSLDTKAESGNRREIRGGPVRPNLRRSARQALATSETSRGGRA
jgi:hypothetical protein